MEYFNFPIVALGLALITLIGVTLYAITQRSSLRSRDEQLVVARAQSYAMLELSQAGVLFLDREHKLMGEASAVAPELLGHTCATGTAFVQTIADLVPVGVRRDAVAYLESLWKAEPTAVVDATANPLVKVHSGARHLTIRFSRLVVDGRVHHIIVSIERISAPRVVPQTIEVPVLNEETFAKRLAGETGVRPALDLAASDELMEPGSAEPSAAPPVVSAPIMSAAAPAPKLPPILTGEFELGPLEVTEDSLPSVPNARPDAPTMTLPTLALPGDGAMAAQGNLVENSELAQHLATTITSPEAAAVAVRPAAPDAAAIIDPPIRVSTKCSRKSCTSTPGAWKPSWAKRATRPASCAPSSNYPRASRRPSARSWC
jgi:hypothetical protein